MITINAELLKVVTTLIFLRIFFGFDSYIHLYRNESSGIMKLFFVSDVRQAYVLPVDFS